MKHIRRTATVITGLLVSTLGLLVGAPAAFAMRLRPQEDPGTVLPSVAPGSGMPGWEIAVIAIAAALFAATLTAVVLRVRFGATLRPATS
jgi:hypothetical protein